jgi:hypothetical protein
MAFAEDLSPFFADFGEAVTVQGAAATGIFDTASDVIFGDVMSVAPALQVPATVAAAEGGTVVVRSTSYRIRQVVDIPPDGAIRQLVLARV